MNDAQPRAFTRPARGRGQAIVEFGLVALLFTLLLMGIVDFAILLNGWLGVSSSARDISRQLAVGVCPPTTTTNFNTSVAYCASGGGGKSNGAPPTGIQGVDPTSPVRVSVSVCTTDTSTCYNV